MPNVDCTSKENAQERMIRALKMGGLCWGFALVSILIPLAHFVLVPSFLIAGPIVGMYFYRLESMVIGGSGNCPACQKPFQIAVEDHHNCFDGNANLLMKSLCQLF